MSADPRSEWSVIVGGAVAVVGVVDYMRSLGEADGDTLTEVLQGLLPLHHPLGRAALAGGLAGGSVVIWRHLCRPFIA